LGLDAWGRRPAEAEDWLEESFARLRRSRPGPADVAQLVLAAARGSLETLGITPFERSHA
jgi:hypothetical protein